MSHDEGGGLTWRLAIAAAQTTEATDVWADLDAACRRLTTERLDRASRLMEERCINEHQRALVRMSAAKSLI